ncbi:Hypothetical protein HVR_LOCUS535 [uncultured virus]|nr:Hypothetical protein HVR_LOCUS535 [uncultured virus]
MASNPNLDRKIQVSQCDVDFWTQQLAQHALFLQDLIDPQVAPDLVEEAKMLYTGWYKQLQNKPVGYNPVFSNSQYSLLEGAHNRLSQGLPINNGISQDDLHDLLRHMVLEQTFFVRLVQGRMTVRNEIQFWIQENREHTALISRLLPPGPFKDQIINLSDRLDASRAVTNFDLAYLNEELNLIKASNQGAITVHNALHAGQIVGLNDAMLEHEMREAQKGEERLTYLISLLQ